MKKHLYYSYNYCLLKLACAFICCLCIADAYAQPKTKLVDSIHANQITVVAGNYSRSGLHNLFLGKNYRKEWTTPVKVTVISLDTAKGGLIPYQKGGGRQSKTLRLHDSAGHEYVLRTIDKTFGRAVPPIAQNTFIEDFADDEVTIGHPYSAPTIAPLAEAAKIYHTNPLIAYIPEQPQLDTFNKEYGNYLYMLEQRPDNDWETAENFGDAKKIISSEKLLKKLLDDNDNSVDQPLYVRSRLFDMFIGDWGRHEDQWRWGVFEEGKKKIYRPIPRDRDQAYSKFGGLLPLLLIRAANMDHLRSFGYNIRGIKSYGFTARHLDRQCANEMTLQQWEDIAKDMQALLTDEVIEKAIRQLPPEIFPISGKQIIDRLKSRRDHLQDFAQRYYTFLARHVDVPGSESREYFEVRRLNDDATLVNVYKITKKGMTEKVPFYSRVFRTDETKDVRLYGIGGADKFSIQGNTRGGINIRIIGGTDIDTITDNSTVGGLRRKTNIYDDENNIFKTGSESHLHLSGDSANHAYNYKEYEYHRMGIKPLIFYNNPDKVFVSIGYGFARHQWRKYPYGSKQGIYLRYSLSENSISLLYDATLYQFAGKWNLGVSANYDAFRSTNFYGLGNETKIVVNDTKYYRLKTREAFGSIGLNRTFPHHVIAISAFIKATGVINDTRQFVSETYLAGNEDLLDYQKFVGAKAGYAWQDVDDAAIPQKGIMLYGGVSYTQNIENVKKGFATYNGIAQLYIPLIHKFSLSIRTGVTSVSGTPEFYQYASIGGNQNFRGLQRDRFWGNTALYNTNELRYITDIRSYLMNGKVGLVALLDDGRVWLNGESSEAWHYAYGGGILLAPFNKFSFTLTYAQSVEGGMVQIRLNKLLDNM
jgi:hypothetical protein